MTKEQLEALAATNESHNSNTRVVEFVLNGQTIKTTILEMTHRQLAGLAQLGTLDVEIDVSTSEPGVFFSLLPGESVAVESKVIRVAPSLSAA